MARSRTVTVSLCVLAATSTAALGCGDGATAPVVRADASALQLSVTSASLQPGESLQIQVTSGGSATWRSSDPGVAEVSGTGMVTAVRQGVAQITASQGGRSARAHVAVNPGVPVEALAFEDGFENGDLAGPQQGYRWRSANAKHNSGVAVSSDLARTGTGSLKFLYGGDPAPCNDGWAEQRFQLGDGLREVWFEYYVYLPQGTEGLGSKFVHRQPTVKNSDGSCSSEPTVATNNKFFALWDTIYDKAKGGDVRVLVEYRRTSLAGEGDSNLYGMWGTDTRTAGHYNQEGSRWDPAFTDALRGRWVQVRIRARVADSKESANGMLQIWVDGALRVNMQGLDLAPEPGRARFFRNGYLMGWSNSGFTENTVVYLDDFKIFRADPGW